MQKSYQTKISGRIAFYQSFFLSSAMAAKWRTSNSSGAFSLSIRRCSRSQFSISSGVSDAPIPRQAFVLPFQLSRVKCTFNFHSS